ncbi:MAG: DUF5618 family protein [bacterium]
MNEPKRYMHNAKDLLKKAGKEDGHYKDAKYVRMACGTAYCGILLALDDYLESRNRKIIKKKYQRKNVNDYEAALSKLNKRLLHKFNAAYHVLHLDGYYEGIVERKVIDAGISVADEIVDGIMANTF